MDSPNEMSLRMLVVIPYEQRSDGAGLEERATRSTPRECTALIKSRDFA